MRIAASLSYTTLLSLVPLLSISFAIFAAFPAFDGVQAQVQSYVFENFVPAAGNAVADYLETFTSKTGNMTTIGILGLGVTSLMLLATIEDALNRIFKVHGKRPLVSRLLMFWALLTLGPLLIGASLSLSTYFYAVSAWVPVDQFGAAEASGFLRLVLPNLMVIAALTFFYLFVPNRPIALKNALIGGSFAGISFAILKKLFGLYISHFPSYQAIYGVLATIPIFLIWMYLTWAVVLMGASVTATLQDWGKVRLKDSTIRHPIEKLRAALHILSIVHENFQKGKGATPVSVLEQTLDQTICHAVLLDLKNSGFVAEDSQSAVFLAKDLSQAPLSNLHHALGLSLGLLPDEKLTALSAQEDQTLNAPVLSFLT